MAKTRSIFAFNIQAGSLLLAIAGLLWFRWYLPRIGHGEFPGLTVVLALAAIAVSVAGRQMRPSRVPRVTFGTGAAVFALLLVVLFAFPSVQRAFVRSEHAGKNSFGGAWIQDLWSADYGPIVLAEPAVADRIRGWIKERKDDCWRQRDNYQLLYMSLLRQGRTLDQIEADPLGLSLLCAMLVAEGGPPTWWPEATWTAQSFTLKPGGTFRMGLLSEAEATARVRRWSQDWTPLEPEHLGSLILALGLHPNLLTRAQADSLFARWRAVHPDDAWALDPVAEGRARLADLAAAVAHGGRVRLAFELPTGESAEFAADFDRTFRRLLGGVGYETEIGKDMVVRAAVQVRDYPSTLWHHMWKDRKYITHLEHKGARKDVISEEYKDFDKEETVLGTLRAPVLVMTVTAGGKELVLEAPPIHFRRATEPVPSPPPVLDATDPASCERYRLPNREALLLGAWNWGLVQ